jgi:hypothetical protein
MITPEIPQVILLPQTSQKVPAVPELPSLRELASLAVFSHVWPELHCRLMALTIPER